MKKIDFNRGWEVCKEVEGKPIGQPQQVNLPHDAMIYEERSKTLEAGGANGYFPGGKYIYSKKFQAPSEWQMKDVAIEFESVYQNSEVYVNGVKAMEWPYGYTNFTVELNEYLRYGEENELKVIADNSKCPNSRWYSGSGIYREVNLYMADKTHIAKDGIRIDTNVRQNIQRLDGVVAVQIATVGCEKGEVQIEIFYEGEIKVQAKGEVTDNQVSVELVVPNAKLWNAKSPNLYQCKVILTASNGCRDEEMIDFGIRTLAWSKEDFLVNGSETLLRGGCIHHDNGILGACNFADAEERRVRILKEAGFNAIRMSHNPMSKEMLSACDKLGMYVMDESFDQWLVHKNPYDYGNEKFKAWWKKDTEAMVIKDYNHPCVIMYSIGNEIAELGTKEGQTLCGEIADFVRTIDASRPVTAGINVMLAAMAAKGKGLYNNEGDSKASGASMDNMPTSEFFNVLMNKMGGIMEKMSVRKGAGEAIAGACEKLDISGYNYAAPRYEKEGTLYPGRVIVGSETLPKVLYHNWQLVKKLPYLIGDFMWTSWDYLGESGIGTIQYKSEREKGTLIISGGAGIVDICGKQRPEVQWGKIIWGLRNKPAIGVEPVTRAEDKSAASMWRDTNAVESWSWEGCEGKRTKVVVYSDAPVVELFVNKKSYGKKKTKEDKAFFKKVVYEPGMIKAVSYDANGNKLAESELLSATGESGLSLSAEKTTLSANGQDLCFIEIDVVGENAITKSSVEKKVTVKVEGPGTLQALGSANPYMEENFYSDTHTTYYGKALAVVRAGYDAGVVKVTVSAEGLEDKIVEITVQLLDSLLETASNNL